MCLEHRACNKVQENSKTKVLELLAIAECECLLQIHYHEARIYHKLDDRTKDA